ncbi:hypothetical protein KI387_043700 [Taxus chinensis]|uniref:Uncharacterized protein n=1 Tax=Taxus chinensis TaxID=29808 RepID=A0AA38LQG2_TAXCH|nr:hypothetical protein KI387_043700 [Taxus chinensis]
MGYKMVFHHHHANFARDNTMLRPKANMLFLNLHFGCIVLSLDCCRLTFLMKIFGSNMMCRRDFKYYSCCTLPMSITSKNFELEMLYYSCDGLCILSMDSEKVAGLDTLFPLNMMCKRVYTWRLGKANIPTSLVLLMKKCRDVHGHYTHSSALLWSDSNSMGKKIQWGSFKSVIENPNQQGNNLRKEVSISFSMCCLHLMFKCNDKGEKAILPSVASMKKEEAYLRGIQCIEASKGLFLGKMLHDDNFWLVPGMHSITSMRGTIDELRANWSFLVESHLLRQVGTRMGCKNLDLRANIYVDSNHRLADLHFSVYVRQFSVPTLLMKLSFSIRFQFGSYYVIVIGLNVQKSNLGLPLAVMNSSELAFSKGIPSWVDVERRLQLKGRNKSDLIAPIWIRFDVNYDCGELFSAPPQSDLHFVIREIASQVDNSFISCFMMETTSVCKKISTAEHAKKGDVTIVFEVEDEEDFHEEKRSRGMSLFGLKFI